VSQAWAATWVPHRRAVPLCQEVSVSPTTNALHEEATRCDAQDPLRAFREHFTFPRGDADQPHVYLCGNSLGLQPKGSRDAVLMELDTWRELAVDGHFRGPNPWYSYHEPLAPLAAQIVGAKPHEVALMGSLTNNLHLLMVSFYRPTNQRYKIIIEGGAFPSDRYAVASQAAFHGLDPNDAIVEIRPRDGEATLRDEDILDTIRREGERVALVLFGAVHYYTGQRFDLGAITAAAHEIGAVAGFDLAHAAGNVPVDLHDSGADFAAWCSYKYLNCGPGSAAGIFVHHRWSDAGHLPRFAGWWGNDPETRFRMPERFSPQRGAAGWQVSNAPVLGLAPFRASGTLFAEATMKKLREKSVALTTFLLDAIEARLPNDVRVITPRVAASRGSQLSLQLSRGGETLQRRLQDAHVIADFRPPDVVRLALAPMYNSFQDAARVVDVLDACLSES